MENTPESTHNDVLDAIPSSGLFKIVRLKDLPNMIQTGIVPKQPDDIIHEGICLYPRAQVTTALAEYFDIMPDDNLATIKSSIRVYHVSFRAICKRLLPQLTKSGETFVIKCDAFSTKYLKSMVI